MQTFTNNQIVIFLLNGLLFELSQQQEIDSEVLELLDRQQCTIEHLSNYTCLGSPSEEFYNVIFNDGTRLHAVCGHHFTTI